MALGEGDVPESLTGGAWFLGLLIAQALLGRPAAAAVSSPRSPGLLPITQRIATFSVPALMESIRFASVRPVPESVMERGVTVDRPLDIQINVRMLHQHLEDLRITVVRRFVDRRALEHPILDTNICARCEKRRYDVDAGR